MLIAHFFLSLLDAVRDGLPDVSLLDAERVPSLERRHVSHDVLGPLVAVVGGERGHRVDQVAPVLPEPRYGVLGRPVPALQPVTVTPALGQRNLNVVSSEVVLLRLLKLQIIVKMESPNIFLKVKPKSEKF